MDSINKRISFIVKELGYNNVSFSKALERDNRMEVQNIVGSKNTKPSPDFLSILMQKFPEINADWLLTGKGRPFKIDIEKENVADFRERFENSLVDKYFWDSEEDQKINELKKEIEIFKVKFDLVEGKLDDKDKIIETMQRLINEIDHKKEKNAP